jgi:hypothetical protein
VEIAVRIAGVLVGVGGAAVFARMLLTGDLDGAWEGVAAVGNILMSLVFAFYGLAGRRVFGRFFPGSSRDVGTLLQRKHTE